MNVVGCLLRRTGCTTTTQADVTKWVEERPRERGGHDFTSFNRNQAAKRRSTGAGKTIPIDWARTVQTVFEPAFRIDLGGGFCVRGTRSVDW